MSHYSVDDEHGNRITTGLGEYEARGVAQRIADQRGKSVYLYEAPDGDYREIRPKKGKLVGGRLVRG